MVHNEEDVLPFRLAYAPGYDLSLGDHVFPSAKFRLVAERLRALGIAGEEDFVHPEPAGAAALELAHDPDWVRALRQGTLTYQQVLRLEIPYSSRMVNAFLLATGGTVEAARRALRDRISFNLAGGFHHAFRGHGEGFCAVNDIAVAIRQLQREGLARRAMVVDLDVHHGNGTAAIFADDPTVFTYSMHQFTNYPAEKPPSSLDVHLPDGLGDAPYLALLARTLEPAMRGFAPELVLYVAGSDPYFEDKLGGLALTQDGLRERDRMVFRMALRLGAPVAVTLAGGYAVLLQDTVSMHVNTVLAARDALREHGAIGEHEEETPA
jgi:acetoin utilization deacetylase AcuC-like enzyme